MHLMHLAVTTIKKNANNLCSWQVAPCFFPTFPQKQTCAVPQVSTDPNQGPEPQFTCSPSNFDVMACWAPSNHGFKLATLACFIHNHLGNHLHNNLPQQAMPWLDQLVSTQPHAKHIEATRDTRKFFHPIIPSSKFGNGGLCCDCPWGLDSQQGNVLKCSNVWLIYF